MTKQIILKKVAEITTLRTLNGKHWIGDKKENIYEAHVGHIHYFNKLGIGDGEKRFREIDWTLTFDEIKKGWGFQYHSFQPFLPEYADGWIEFRDLYQDKDQIIRYKANTTRGCFD